MIRSRSTKFEAVFAILCVAIVVYAMRQCLIYSHTTFGHDNAYWNFPVFHFLAARLADGEFPLWNPFSHGGEPFYPLLFQIRLLEPVTLLFLSVGTLFTRDSLLLFHWHRILLLLLNLSGIYFWLRPLSKNIWIRLTLIPILLFSSLFLGSLQQDGTLNCFLWAPWILVLLTKIWYAPKPDPKLFIALGLGLGWSFQSYFLAGPFTWIFLLAVGAFACDRFRTRKHLRSPVFIRQAGLALLITSLIGLPNWILFSQKDRFVFPLRMAPPGHTLSEANGGPLPAEGGLSDISHGTRMPYSFVVHTGGATQPWDFLQLLSPNGNGATHGDENRQWGEPSDTFLFLGTLPWCIAFFGLWVRRPRPRGTGIIFFATVAMAFLALGPAGGIHRVLYTFLPPLWLIRNTGLFAHYFLMGVLFFFVIGAEALINRRTSFFRSLANQDYFQIGILGLSFLFTFLILTHSPRQYLVWLGFVPMAIWLSYRCLEPRRVAPYLFAVSLAIQVGLIFLFHRHPVAWGMRVAGILALPALLFGRKSRWLLPAIFVITFGELGIYLHSSRALYAQQLPPTETLGVRMDRPFPLAPAPRAVSAYYHPEHYRSGARYTELIRYLPVALSPEYPFARSANPSFDYLRSAQRWTSFLLNKQYFQAIHSELSSAKLSDLLAVGKNPLVGPGTWSVEKYSANQLHLKVQSAGGPFTWHQSSSPDWRAYLDGKPVPIATEAGLTQIVTVPVGSHRLDFRYEPRALWWALAASFATSFFGFAYLVGNRFYRRKFSAMQPIQSIAPA